MQNEKKKNLQNKFTYGIICQVLNNEYITERKNYV